MHSITAKPRSICGPAQAANPQSGVIQEASHRDAANRLSPTVMTRRGSARWDSLAAMRVEATWVTPTMNTVRPICRALYPRTRPRKTGTR